MYVMEHWDGLTASASPGCAELSVTKRTDVSVEGSRLDVAGIF